MTWATRDFRTYSAKYPNWLRSAVASTPTSILCGGFPSHSAAAAEALTFRQYRHLIRQQPTTDLTLTNFIQSWSFRTKITESSFGVWELLLTAKPRPLSDFLALNPELTRLVL